MAKSKKRKAPAKRSARSNVAPLSKSVIAAKSLGKGMIDVTDLTGHVIYVSIESIVQIYYSDYRSPASGSILICGGLMQATHEPTDELVSRIRDRVRLINLHIGPAGPTSFPIWINVDHIVGLKAMPHGTIVWVGLKAPEVVVEDYSAVIAMIDGAAGPLATSVSGPP